MANPQRGRQLTQENTTRRIGLTRIDEAANPRYGKTRTERMTWAQAWSEPKIWQNKDWKNDLGTSMVWTQDMAKQGLKEWPGHKHGLNPKYDKTRTERMTWAQAWSEPKIWQNKDWKNDLGTSMVWTQNMTKQALDYWQGEMRWLTQETTQDQGNEVANTHKMTKQGLADWPGEMNNWHQVMGWLTKKTTRIRQLSWEVEGILPMKRDWMIELERGKANRRKQQWTRIG